MSLMRASLAISRRTLSKAETMTTPGVSSTMTSTPVSFSKARMLRPSRPMMRPFMSSLGISTVEAADFVKLLLFVAEDAVELFFADFDGPRAVDELVLGELEHPLFFDEIFVLLVLQDFVLVEQPLVLAELVSRA